MMSSYTYGDEILMNFETANDTHKQMGKTISEITIALYDSDLIIRNELLPYWQGGSAAEFSNLYNTTYESYAKFIGQLIRLAERFRQNIDGFQEMSSDLSGWFPVLPGFPWLIPAKENPLVSKENVMTVIEMDIDGAKACSSDLHTLCDEMESFRRNLITKGESLETVWRSDSETKFLEGLLEQMNEFSTKIEGLRRCAGRLDAAIAAAWKAQMGLAGG
jgi:uncharacterized protein YukE